MERKRWFLTVLKQPVDAAIGVWTDGISSVKEFSVQALAFGALRLPLL
jgi:hypothetical protein